MLIAKVSLPRDAFSLEVSLQIADKGVTAFYGHSGSGKTSLLRCIAGLERASSAYVEFNGQVWQDNKHFVPTYKRPIGYVFQEASLFEHLNINNNLQFAIKRAPKGAATDLKEIIALLGIEHLMARYPAQLSGGERQRVAIARALLVSPSLLLMDEPLASLDHKRKQDILPYLENIKQELDMPIVYVSHSPEEIARLADNIVVLSNGKAVQSGSLTDTLTHLDSPLKLGEDSASVIQAKVVERDQHWHLTKLAINGGDLWFRDLGHQVGQTVRVRVLARDVSLALSPQQYSSILNVLPAEVVALEQDSHPGLTLVKLAMSSQPYGDIILARISSRSAHRLRLRAGLAVWAHIKSAAVIQ